MSYDEWMRRTNRPKKIGSGNKDRSDALQLVDGYLQNYTNNSTPDSLDALGHFLDAWASGKMRQYFWQDEATLKTIRDHDGAVTALKRQVDRARTLWDPLLWNAAYPGIFIGQDTYRGIHWVPDDFVGHIRLGLEFIAKKPVGRGLLERISELHRAEPRKKVVIEYTGVMSAAAPLSVITKENRKKVQRTSQLVDAYSITELMDNPDIVAERGTARDDEYGFIGAPGAGCIVMLNHADKGLDGRPMYIALAHELIHGLHYMSGMCYRSLRGGLQTGHDTGIMEEEMRTVGLNQYADEVPSENAIRDEWEIDRRTEYGPNMDFSNVTATRLAT